jgi:hypothetical protein
LPPWARKAAVPIVTCIFPAIEAIEIVWVEVLCRLVGCRSKAWYLRDQAFVVPTRKVQLCSTALCILEALLALRAIRVFATAAPLAAKLVCSIKISAAEVIVHFIVD